MVRTSEEIVREYQDIVVTLMCRVDGDVSGTGRPTMVWEGKVEHTVPE